MDMGYVLEITRKKSYSSQWQSGGHRRKYPKKYCRAIQPKKTCECDVGAGEKETLSVTGLKTAPNNLK